MTLPTEEITEPQKTDMLSSSNFLRMFKFNLRYRFFPSVFLFPRALQLKTAAMLTAVARHPYTRSTYRCKQHCAPCVLLI